MWDIQELFRRHRHELTRFLQRRGASPETAADLMQETFLKLLTVTPAGQVDNVRAYIFQTASNLSIDLARRGKVLSFVDDSHAAFERLADEAPSPERVVLSRQELALLQAALEQLPQRPRDVFLARLDGRTFEEIGRSLGMPTQTAFSQMVKVMMHLTAALGRTQK